MKQLAQDRAVSAINLQELRTKPLCPMSTEQRNKLKYIHRHKKPKLLIIEQKSVQKLKPFTFSLLLANHLFPP
jgi:hypothetical protein